MMRPKLGVDLIQVVSERRDVDDCFNAVGVHGSHVFACPGVSLWWPNSGVGIPPRVFE